MTRLVTQHGPILLAALMGLLIGALMFIRPQLNALAETQISAEEWRHILHESEAAEAALPAQREALQQRRQAIRQHRIRIPAQIDITALIAKLTQTATMSGVRIQRLKPGSDQRISMVTQGSWSQAITFLHGLLNLPVAVTIETFAAYPQSSDRHHPRITLEMMLAAHASSQADAAGELPPPPSSSTEISARAKPPIELDHNPFAAGPAAIAAPAAKLPFSYAGEIQVGRTTWALLKHKNGVIQRHRIGAAFDDGWHLVDVTEAMLFVRGPQGQVHPIPLRHPPEPGDS